MFHDFLTCLLDKKIPLHLPRNIAIDLWVMWAFFGVSTLFGLAGMGGETSYKVLSFVAFLCAATIGAIFGGSFFIRIIGRFVLRWPNRISALMPALVKTALPEASIYRYPIENGEITVSLTAGVEDSNRTERGISFSIARGGNITSHELMSGRIQIDSSPGLKLFYVDSARESQAMDAAHFLIDALERAIASASAKTKSEHQALLDAIANMTGAMRYSLVAHLDELCETAARSRGRHTNDTSEIVSSIGETARRLAQKLRKGASAGGRIESMLEYLVPRVTSMIESLPAICADSIQLAALTSALDNMVAIEGVLTNEARIRSHGEALLIQMAADEIGSLTSGGRNAVPA